MARPIVVGWCAYVGLFGLHAVMRFGFTGDALASAAPFLGAGTLAARVTYAVREPPEFTKEIVRWTKAGLGTFLALSFMVPAAVVVEYPGTTLAFPCSSQARCWWYPAPSS